jgi:hypothetical protein
VKALAILILIASTAHADDEHYELLANDLTADALMAPSIARDAPGDTAEKAMALGIVIHVFGAPVIHWAHREWGSGAVDLGVRAVAPMVGWITGDLACEHWDLDDPGHDYNHCYWLATTGFAVGAVGAQVLDWLVISRPDQPHTIMLTLGARF